MLLPSCKNFSYIYLLTFFFKEIGMRYIEISKFYQVQRIVSGHSEFLKEGWFVSYTYFQYIFHFLNYSSFLELFIYILDLRSTRILFSSLLDIYFPPSKMCVVRNKPVYSWSVLIFNFAVLASVTSLRRSEDQYYRYCSIIISRENHRSLEFSSK